MAAWIYLFSKFTSEALLLEALCILFLFAGYAAFWILKKRRFGAIRMADVPAPVVKAYLSQLIIDAHQLRAQLFGLLSASGALPPSLDGPSPSLLKLGAAADPGLQAKLDALEHKMSDQMIAYEKILTEKEQIEKELALVRAGQPSSAKGSQAGPTPGSEELPKLKDKISVLEARLAEYSVIEDDLANLKRLQQENAQLRSQLGVGAGAGARPSTPGAAAPAGLAAAPAGGQAAATEGPGEPSLTGAAPSSADLELEGPTAGDDGNLQPAPELKSAALAAAEAMSAAQPETESPSLSPNTAQAQAETELESPGEAQASANAASRTSGLDQQAKPEAPGSSGFEKLVDQVEKSLGTDPKTGKGQSPAAAGADTGKVANPAAAPSNVETPSVSTTTIPKANVEKSDEDLIAEFEKMLSS